MGEETCALKVEERGELIPTNECQLGSIEDLQQWKNDYLIGSTVTSGGGGRTIHGP